MRFFLDRNLPPALAKGLAALCAPDGIAVEHHDDRFERTTPDVDWIGALGREGDWVVVTQDRLTRDPPERQALKSTGLLVFILSKGWSHAVYWDKAAALVRWMPILIGIAGRINNGAYTVPHKFSGKGKVSAVEL